MPLSSTSSNFNNLKQAETFANSPIRPLHFWIKLDISLQSQHYAVHAAAGHDTRQADYRRVYRVQRLPRPESRTDFRFADSGGGDSDGGFEVFQRQQYFGKQ